VFHQSIVSVEKSLYSRKGVEEGVMRKETGSIAQS